MPPEGRLPDIPDCVAYLWSDYKEIRQFISGDRIGMDEIGQYSQIMQIMYNREEIKVLISLDRIRQRVIYG